MTFQSKYYNNYFYSKYFQFINSVYLLLVEYKLIITTIINYIKLLHFTFIYTIIIFCSHFSVYLVLKEYKLIITTIIIYYNYKSLNLNIYYFNYYFFIVLFLLIESYKNYKISLKELLQ